MNRLSKEKSPYLLQHANNPVDWYPWGDEAFKKARDEDKPVFLSIGYATCHWCHVMEHESFEDEEVAALMNNAFVNIKVDREERPDIDNTYMTICQMLTGHGGWPLTIVMTPDKEPFYAATYLPKHSRPNQPGMIDFAPAIENAWKTDRDNIKETVERIKNGFAKTLEFGESEGKIPANISETARRALISQFDSADGGFGSSPKFPSPHNLLFLIQHYKRTGKETSLEMVHLTLKKMRLGGLWDHVGFGFHRYATDHKWLLPHFEKMLYDQAMLMLAYTEGWLITKDPLFKQTVYEIADYVKDCLAFQEGAFFSAEDADSEGVEGKFYVWETDEIKRVLNEDDAALFMDLFNIKDEGNFRDEATHQKTGKNIPHLTHSITEEAEKREINPNELEKKAAGILAALKMEREKRVRPLLDDKILTDWNGLMIAAFARAGVVFNEPSFILKAESAWMKVKEHCFVNGKLLHRLKDGDAAIDGMANDYAFIIWGLIELYKATFNPEFLNEAVLLQREFDDEFYDDAFGGYYFTAKHAEELLGRQKEIYDGAIPSSNSVAAHNGFYLSKLTANPRFQEKSDSIFNVFPDQIGEAPSGFTHAIHAYDLLQADSAEVVITAMAWNEMVDEAISICREKLPAGSVILVKTEKWENQLNSAAPFVENYPVHHALSVYVCKNFECKTPVHSIADLEELLED